MTATSASSREETSSPRSTPSLGVNVLFNLAGHVVMLVAAFFAIPYTARHLGPSTYGALALVATYVESLNVLNLGINTSLTKYLAELLPRGASKEIDAYLRTSLALFLIVGLVVSLPVAVGAPWIVKAVLEVPPDIAQDVVFAFRLGSVALYLRFLSQVTSAVPIAAQRFDLVNYVNVSSELLRIVGSVVVIFLGFRLRGVMVITFLASIVSTAAYLFLVRKLMPHVRMVPSFSRTHFLNLFDFSKFVLISNVSGRVVATADNVIIGAFLPIASVAFYSVPYTIGQKLWALLGNAAAAIFPAASALSGPADRQRLIVLYARANKILAVLTLLPSLALLVLARQLLDAWIGPEFAERGAKALQILSLGFLLNSLAHVPYLLLQAVGRPNLAARIAAVYALLNLCLFILLIPRFGVVGAATAFLLSQLVVVPWTHVLANRAVGAGVTELYPRSFSWLLVASAVVVAIFAIARPYAASLPALAVAGLVGSIAYFALCWFLVLSPDERLSCRALVLAEPPRKLR